MLVGMRSASVRWGGGLIGPTVCRGGADCHTLVPILRESPSGSKQMVKRRRHAERREGMAAFGGMYVYGRDPERDRIRREALRNWHQSGDNEYMYEAGIWARPESDDDEQE